jgi:(p)ppGpp synthase/HD superfamily hydrolase
MFLQTHSDKASRYQKAIIFLSNRIEGSGNNPKPVVMHSIQVGSKLVELGMEDDVVFAGFLHDLIEDSATTEYDIAIEFGDGVAKLVKALTFDESITDQDERYQENFQRCLAAGEGAMVIRAVDLLMNSSFYQNDGSEKYGYLVRKWKTFMELAKQVKLPEGLMMELEAVSQKL